ncbi:hypothetical protein C478_10558 [Natrinema thermotolerans DSM 11552]|nr:hypothetical protein C478_10558 [Natrinema thermotolerans DSM 11552]
MLTDQQEILLIAIALTELSIHCERVDPELSSEAWQLAADRLVDHDVGLAPTSNQIQLLFDE